MSKDDPRIVIDQKEKSNSRLISNPKIKTKRINPCVN
jgi:hypothetical protein